MIAGVDVFAADAASLRWAEAAFAASDPLLQGAERRHGGTWAPGIDLLPNASDGSVGGVPLPARFGVGPWHRAQVSVVWPGYPARDADEGAAAHRFRRVRDAAHVDGLLPEGPERRRHLREPHAFILGIALNPVPDGASPLVVWEGSHLVMGAAFRNVFEGVTDRSSGDLDVTDIYQSARREVFETCPRREVVLAPGAAVRLHRHLVHGVAPWAGASCPEGRRIAYFRPLCEGVDDWLSTLE